MSHDLFTQPAETEPTPNWGGGKKSPYSDADLEEFRALILKEIDHTRTVPVGTFPALTEERRTKMLRLYEDALKRIDNGTYGICRVTGDAISKERLRLVPHATLSIEAKRKMLP